MRKIYILLFYIVTLNCFSQQTFDHIKSLDSFKKNDLLDKIDIIKYKERSIQEYINSNEQLQINNLYLFLKNPFDKEISSFDFIGALKMVDEVYKKIPIEESSDMIISDPNSPIPVKDSDKDGVQDKFDKCPYIAGSYRNDGCPEEKDMTLALSSLSSALPSGYQASTQIIDAMSKFLVDRTKQELTLTFYENFKDKLDKTIIIEINNDPAKTVSIKLKELFTNTNLLFESKKYFETPSLGEVWLIAFKKDLNELPFKMEELIKKNFSLLITDEGHFAIVSFDIINKLKIGSHPITILEELNETYNVGNDYKYEIDQVISLLQLLSKNLSTDIQIDGFKEVKWITGNDLAFINEEQKKYVAGLIYQVGRNNNLFKKMKLKNGVSIEDYITKDNYSLMYTFIKKTLGNYSIIEQKLSNLKKNKDQNSLTNELHEYIDFINTFYGLFDSTLESYHALIKSNQYYQSDYYLKYKPIISDIIDFNTARADSNYAECLMLTNRFLTHLMPNSYVNSKVIKEITFYGNFMVDVLNSVKNQGDIKLVIEKYAMPISSYRIKRTFNSSWDINAYPGLYFGYEFSGSNSLSYGITAPIGFSYSFKNKNLNNDNLKSSSSTLFLCVIDIGAPFSYRFANDEAEGLPEDISWEQVFSPGLFYIYGFSNAPLSIGLNAQFSPLLRKIQNNNQLDTKNVFRVGFVLLVDIPLFNLTNSNNE